MTSSQDEAIAAARLKGILNDFRRGDIALRDAITKLKYGERNLDEAIRLLGEQQETSPDQHGAETLVQCYLNRGDFFVAKALCRDIYHTHGRAHITNLILGGVQATVAIVDDQKRVLYVPFPKCGSSTIKNYFTFAMYGQSYGELVHFRHPEIYRIVTPDDLAGKYAKYRKFCVIRDPISRVTSYYMTNIQMNSLKREANGNDRYFGLQTKTGPYLVARNFGLYRQMFIDFRHHTDAMSGYLNGMQHLMDEIIPLSDIGKVKSMLEDLYGVTIPDERSMVGKEGGISKETCMDAFASLKTFYREDYERFF